MTSERVLPLSMGTKLGLGKPLSIRNCPSFLEPLIKLIKLIVVMCDFSDGVGWGCCFCCCLVPLFLIGHFTGYPFQQRFDIRRRVRFASMQRLALFFNFSSYT